MGWRGVFVVLALASAVMALAFLALPEPPRATAGERTRVMDILAIPPVRVGLLACLLNMAGFYGTYAYLGAAVRAVHQGGGGLAGLVVLAYGLGFTAAVPLGGIMDKLSPRRTLALSMAALAAIFLVLPAATRTLPALLAVMAVLGIVQHTALNGLVSILGSVSAERRGSITALQSVATYVGLMAGTAAMGPVYDRFGFPTVSWTSAVIMAAAALAGLRLRRL